MEIKPNSVYKQRYTIVRAMDGTPPGGLYLGRDMSLEQAVLIRFRQSPGGAGDQQFMQSAARLMEIQHPNIARVVDSFVEAGLQGLVMEYIPGDNLVTFIQQYGALTMPELEPWVQKLSHALTYLHSRKPAIVHGDIRPSNLILTPESDLILINYGMPELGGEPLPADQAAFTSPEREEKADMMTPSADQYALAATLYFLLTKQSPPSAYQRQVEGAGITPLHTLKTQIPSSLHPVMAKALALRPQDRHLSIKDFSLAFLSTGKAAAPQPVPYSPPAPVPQSAQPVPLVPPGMNAVPSPQQAVFVPRTSLQQGTPAAPKKRLPAALIIALVVIGIGALTGGFFLVRNLLRSGMSAATGDPSTWPTVTPKSATPTVELPTLAPTEAPGATSPSFPSESLIAYISNKGDGTSDQLWLMRIGVDEYGAPRVFDNVQLTEGGCNKSQPAWDPTGMYLVFVCDTGTEEQGKDLYVLDFSSENMTIEQITSMPGDETEPVFSPDATYLAWVNLGSVSPEQSVIFFSENMSDVEVIQQNLGEYSPSFSADGMHMAYVADEANGNFVIRVADRSDLYLSSEYFDPQLRQKSAVEVEWAPDGEKIAYTHFDPETYAMYIHLTTWTSRGDDDQQLTDSGGDWGASFSPDSQWIIFTSVRDGNEELYLMSADGTGEEINLTNSQWIDKDPAWFPVLAADRSGQNTENFELPTYPVRIEGTPTICGDDSFNASTQLCSYADDSFVEGENVIIIWNVLDFTPGTVLTLELYSENGEYITSDTMTEDGATTGFRYNVNETPLTAGNYYLEVYYDSTYYGRYWFSISPSSGGGGGE